MPINTDKIKSHRFIGIYRRPIDSGADNPFDDFTVTAGLQISAVKKH
jgi:hypothetical protein